MTNLTKKRIDIINKTIVQHGIEFGNNIFISLWDVSGNINKTWCAEHFINRKLYPSASTHGYVLADFRIYKMFRAIRNAVKKSGYIELRESYNNKSEYLQITNHSTGH